METIQKDTLYLGVTNTVDKKRTVYTISNFSA